MDGQTIITDDDHLLLRPMLATDMGDVDRLQRRCYRPELRDSAAALHSRIALPGHHCFVLVRNGVLTGYILAHPWPSMAPPPVDTVLILPDGGDLIHYVHDLSIAPEGRGIGDGQRLVAASQAAARAAGLTASELIAIDGAASYWRRHGYAGIAGDQKLSAKVECYGPQAVYMRRTLDQVE